MDVKEAYATFLSEFEHGLVCRFRSRPTKAIVNDHSTQTAICRWVFVFRQVVLSWWRVEGRIQSKDIEQPGLQLGAWHFRVIIIVAFGPLSLLFIPIEELTSTGRRSVWIENH